MNLKCPPWVMNTPSFEKNRLPPCIKDLLNSTLEGSFSFSGHTSDSSSESSLDDPDELLNGIGPYLKIFKFYDTFDSRRTFFCNEAFMFRLLKNFLNQNNKLSWFLPTRIYFVNVAETTIWKMNGTVYIKVKIFYSIHKNIIKYLICSINT